MSEPLHKKKIDLVIVALSTPVKIGIYEKTNLIEEIESDEKTSEFLPKIYQKLKKEYDIRTIFFARGPGSFMSIKLVYIFLKTLQISKNIELKACDGFEFSKNSPIKAMGNLCFVKENGKITLKKFDKKIKSEFFLPKTLDEIKCSENLEPLYILPAV